MEGYVLLDAVQMCVPQHKIQGQEIQKYFPLLLLNSLDGCGPY